MPFSIHLGFVEVAAGGTGAGEAIFQSAGHGASAVLPQSRPPTLKLSSGDRNPRVLPPTPDPNICLGHLKLGQCQLFAIDGRTPEKQSHEARNIKKCA